MKDKHAEKAKRLFRALGLLHYLKTPRVKDIALYEHLFLFPIMTRIFQNFFLMTFKNLPMTPT